MVLLKVSALATSRQLTTKPYLGTWDPQGTAPRNDMLTMAMWTWVVTGWPEWAVWGSGGNVFCWWGSVLSMSASAVDAESLVAI
jgi:hypothetical protein